MVLVKCKECVYCVETALGSGAFVTSECHQGPAHTWAQVYPDRVGSECGAGALRVAPPTTETAYECPRKHLVVVGHASGGFRGPLCAICGGPTIRLDLVGVPVYEEVFSVR